MTTKKISILSMAVLMLVACGTRQETCSVDTALILTDDSIPADLCYEIRERNIMGVWVDPTGNIFLNHDFTNTPPPPPPPGEPAYEYEDDRVPCDIGQLRGNVIHFLTNPNDEDTLPEKNIIDIPLLGEYLVSKGGVSLLTMEGAPEESVDHVCHELAAAIIILRDSLSLKAFGMHYCELTDDQAAAIRTAIPTPVYNPQLNRFYKNAGDD
jgi:hypothetical protein